jgi:hypothetical protein
MRSRFDAPRGGLWWASVAGCDRQWTQMLPTASNAFCLSSGETFFLAIVNSLSGRLGQWLSLGERPDGLPGLMGFHPGLVAVAPQVVLDRMDKVLPDLESPHVCAPLGINTTRG